MSKLKDCVTDKNHPDNYWVSNFIDGRVKCHHCEKTYAYVGSLKAHGEKSHGVTVSKKQRKDKGKLKAKMNYMDICCYSSNFPFYIKTWMMLSTWLMKREALNQQSMNFLFTIIQTNQVYYWLYPFDCNGRGSA